MCGRKLGFIKLLHSTGVSREKIEVTWNLITTSIRYHSKLLLLFLLLSIKVATTFPGSSPSRPLERETERERDPGKRWSRVPQQKKNSLDGVPVFSFFIFHYFWLASPSLYVMFCHLPDSWRHLTSVFQGLSLSRSRGREGGEPGNAVVKVAESIGFCKKRSHGTWRRASSLIFPHWDIKTKRPEPVKLDQQ